MVTAMGGSLLAACSKGDSGDGADKHVLRVGFMYSNSDNEPYLRQQFTDSYELTHPNIDIEIAAAINYDDQRFDPAAAQDPSKQPDPYEKLKEMLTGPNPVDVVILDPNYLKRLVQDNLLKQLDPLIQDSKFDISDYVPTVIDGIKDAGGGDIYALTPTFSSSALFYNKKMFADAGVQPPADNMQWQDIFNLAKRISATSTASNKVFGFQFNRYSGDPFSDMMTYSAPLQLKIWDSKGEKMTVDTPQWAQVWKDIAGVYKDKVVPSQDDINKFNQDMSKPAQNGKPVTNPYMGDLFVNGKVAMTIASYDYVNELAKSKDYNAKNKDVPTVDWDVVTVPTFPQAPGVGGNIYLSNLMAINAKAQNSDDAWDFIQFNNSEEWAKLKSRSTYEMVSRKSYLKPKDGLSYNMQAFYTLKPVPPQDTGMDELSQKMPNIWQVQNYGQPLFQDVLQGKKTVEQALKEWQTKGDQALQKLKADPNAPLDPPGGNGGGKVIYDGGGWGG